MIKTYFVYRFDKNPNTKKTYTMLEKNFGKGYIFGRKYPNASKMDRKETREKFTKDMKQGGFKRVIVDITYGKGKFMKEEIALAKKLKIPIIEVKFIK